MRARDLRLQPPARGRRQFQRSARVLASLPGAGPQGRIHIVVRWRRHTRLDGSGRFFLPEKERPRDDLEARQALNPTTSAAIW